MKRVSVVRLCLVVSYNMFIVLACDDMPPGEPVDEGTLHDSIVGCCQITFHASVIVGLPEDGKVVLLEMWGNNIDRPLKVSWPILVSATADTTIDLYLNVSHNDTISAGDYTLKINRYNPWDLPNYQKRTTETGDLGIAKVPSWAQEDCSSCCQGIRKYDELRGYKFGVTAVRANVTARYGLPCDYPNSWDYSFGLVQTSVAYELESGTVWGQIGIAWERSPNDHLGKSLVYPHIYAESFGDGGFILSRFYSYGPDTLMHPPSDGDTATITCLLDTNTATFHFDYRGNELVTPLIHYHPMWFQFVGMMGIWGGEIMNQNDDMPGTYSNPCYISSMRWSTPLDSFIALGDDPPLFDTIIIDDVSEWDLERTDPNNIKIWDINPQ